MSNSVDIPIPEECKPLIEMCKQTVSRERYDISVYCKEFRSEREIDLCETKSEKKYFLKSNQGKQSPIRDRFILKDLLAFLISSRLGFDVVPTTLVVGSHDPAPAWDLNKPEIKKKIDSLLGIEIYNATAIQLAIQPLDRFQPHPLNSDPHLRDIKLKESLVKWMRESSSNTNLTNALLFNMVTGRLDGEPRNSVIRAGNDKEKARLYEVDNEMIGYRTTDSWLMWLLQDVELPRSPLEACSEIKFEILDSVFQDMKGFGTITDWNTETYMDDKDYYEENIKSNFKDLQSALKIVLENQKGAVPTMELLKAFNKIRV